MIKRCITLLILLSSSIFLLRCSVESIADGSGSDIGNGMVIGTIYFSDGKPASNTKVMLVPNKYNPVTDGALPDSLIDTTNDMGMYSFLIKEKGEFNVEAVHLTNRTRILNKGISITNTKDTLSLPYGILKETGTIVVYLDKTIDTVDCYIYIEGTTYSIKLSNETIFAYDENSMIIDSVPEATIENVYIFDLKDPSNHILVIDTVDVVSNEVTEIDGFVFYTNYTSENSGLPGNTINDIYVDRIYKTWFATNSGVGKLDNISNSQKSNMVNNWTVYNTNNSDIPSNSVLSIKYVAMSKIRFATLGGSATLMGGTWLNYTTSNSDIATDLILDVEVDSDDNLWLATSDKGLLMFDGTDWTVVCDSANSVIPSNTILSVQADLNDTMWCVTPDGVLTFKEPFHCRFIYNAGLMLDKAYCMAIDHKRHKWFGGVGGVTRYNEADEVWTHYTSYHSAVFTDSVLTIVEDENGIMWFGTIKGMTKFDGVTWHDYSGERYKMLENKGVRAITFDSYGNTWIGTTNNGVIAFGPTIK